MACSVPFLLAAILWTQPGPIVTRYVSGHNFVFYVGDSALSPCVYLPTVATFLQHCLSLEHLGHPLCGLLSQTFSPFTLPASWTQEEFHGKPLFPPTPPFPLCLKLPLLLRLRRNPNNLAGPWEAQFWSHTVCFIPSYCVRARFLYKSLKRCLMRFGLILAVNVLE